MYRDLSEEIQQHILEKTESLVDQGMSRADAEYCARRDFGNVTGIEERSREAWVWPIVDSLCGDIRYALRQLRKNYGFATTAILTLAIGIGATTAIFSLVNTVLLRPLPFPKPNRLTWIKQQDHSLPGVIPASLSYPDYFDWRALNHSFAGIASYTGRTVALESGAEARHLDATVVSTNFFDVLGTAPMLGRDFRPDEEKPGNRAVMLSYSLWQSAFGSARDITSRTIRLGDHDYVIVGVMPKDFQFPIGSPAPALWISLSEDADGKDPRTAERGFDCLDVIGRLKPGVILEQAKADLSLIAGNLARRYPDSNKWFTSAMLEPELQRLTGDVKPAFRLLFAAVMLMLLIACANVGSLLMARSSGRSAELAVRASIGASRAAIVRQLLVESVVLSVCGGIAGVVLSLGLLNGALHLMPLSIPRVENVTIDGPALLFVTAVSVVTGLLFGVLPAWRMSQLRPSQAMREGFRSVAGGREQHRAHNGLVVAQTAISLVLLVSSGLLIRSFVRIQSVDPGFDPEHVWTARVELLFDKLNHDQHVQFYNRLLERVSRMPGVQSASAGWPLPLSDSIATVSFNIRGRAIAKGDEPSESVAVVMAGYFETMRIPLISGRRFGPQDGAKAMPVMMINQAFARKYFGDENPLGKQIQVELGDGVINRPVREVIGVVGDVKAKSLLAGAAPQYYLPYAQAVITNPFITIRTSGNPAILHGALRAAVHEMDPTVPVYQVSTLDAYVSKSVAMIRFQTVLLSGFAAVALLLAGIGLYSLLSYMVVQRSREIGVRIALGAQRTDVLRMILYRGSRLTCAGLGAGLVISAITTGFLSGMLYGVRPYDLISFAGMAGVLLVAGLLASSIPAYRAAQLDPIETLRQQ
jgi:predicted permease